MTTQQPDTQLTTLAEALGDLRDSWVLISMALKDQLAESPSTLRDEVAVQLNLQLARIQEGVRGSFE